MRSQPSSHFIRSCRDNMFTQELDVLLRSIPQRSTEVEMEIDRKHFLSSYSSESILVYLNALSLLVSDWMHTGDRRSKNAIIHFFSSKNFQLSGSGIAHLTLQEENYLHEISRHLTNIREAVRNIKFTDRHVYNQIINEAENYLLNSAWDSKAIEEKIISTIAHAHNLVCRHSSNSDEVIIHVTNINRTICIINDRCDEISSPYPITLIINHNDFSKISKNVLRKANILDFSYKITSGSFEYLNSHDTLDWCVMKVQHAINGLELLKQSDVMSQVIQELNGCLYAIESIRFDILDASRLKWDPLRLEDVKRVRIKLANTVNNLLFRKDNESYLTSAYQAMVAADRGLRLMFYGVTQRLDLDGNISFCVSEIRKNNALYALSGNQAKTLDTVLGEENLSAILASNLQCIYRNPHSRIVVRCESRVGNGRSDITIERENKTISIIESKLLKQRSNIIKEVSSAINQLFDRYSEHLHVDMGRYLQLYAIIFCHDKNLISMDEKIFFAIREYAANNGLTYEIHETTENQVRFTYVEPRTGEMLSDKIRTITLIVCNMEVEWKSRAKDRTNIKKL
ncbi:hypothetical protein ALQ33_02890 [Pseudomonas syringae pv. philadelphi]|uniref:Uncharacterized protein n=2 Tax=Pseudomonas syringae group genomosp. 3 TaxID=251701 RepID=A0A3M3Z1A9_9PSED|nr:hypothetical protein ALQ33_02890 [Pseudomonas syringae pv. philadelphi]